MTKAFNLALKGCDLGNMYSCANLSQMYQRGEGIFICFYYIIVTKTKCSACVKYYFSFMNEK